MLSGKPEGRPEAPMSDLMTSEDLDPRLLIDREVLAEPYGFFHRLVADAPVWCVPATGIVVASSFEAVTEATKRVVDFSSNLRSLIYRGDDGSPALLEFGNELDIDALATADPPLHTAHRGAVFPELVARRMRELRPDVEALTDQRLDLALGTGRTEFMATVGNAVPIRVVSALIGFRDEDPDLLLQTAFDSTSILAATMSLDEITEVMGRTGDVIAWMDEQLRHAAEDGAEGVLGAVMAAIADNVFSREVGIGIMHILLSAGGESTTSLLGSAVHLLASDPELQDRLRADPELLTPFIEEMLRLESPFRAHLRSVPETTELLGTAIPAGSTMLLLWAAANRDPAEYDRPDDVVLDRPTPRHHLAFGRGIHLCVGAPLARLEAEVVLTRLLARTHRIELDADDPPVRENSLLVRRFVRLPLILH
jgi:cytochrome P450